MIVVSDTSAVTSLIQIGRVDLLQHVFQEVFIPPAVHEELRRFHQQLPEFLRVSAPRDVTLVRELLGDVGQGEAEAIALARELRADFLLIDEKRGRTIAKNRGLRVIGLLGVLLRAKQQRLLDSLADAMRALEDQAGFRVSEEVKAIILKAADEA